MSRGWDYAVPADSSRANERAAFIRRTYAHLAGAILATIGLETLLLAFLWQGPKMEGSNMPIAAAQLLQLMWGSGINYLIVFGFFFASNWIAQSWAHSQTSVGLQYAGLGLSVVAWSVMFLPLLIIAWTVDPNSILQAGIMTGCVFGGLTTVVFITRKDFSFLGPILSICSWIALGVIVCACFGLFTLGLLFSFAMVALVSGYILYDTSNVLHRYNTNQHVAAALALYADVALLFWYILQIVLASGRD